MNAEVQSGKSKSTFSTVISYLSHPIFIPTIGVLAITTHHWVSASKYSDAFMNRLLLILVLTTVFIPIFAMGSLFQKYQPKEFTTLEKNERSFAAFIIGGVYLALIWLLPVLYDDVLIRVFFIAMATSSILAGLVNFREKISFHAIGWSGLWVMLFFLNQQSFNDLFVLLLLVIVWIGFVAFARIREEAHTARQFYLGLFMGMIVNFFVYSIAF